MLFKEKYIAIFVLKKGKSYSIRSRRKFNATKNTLSFEKLTIPINNEVCSFSEGLKNFFVIDIVLQKQLFFENFKGSGVNATLVDKILSDSIITQLTSNLSDYSAFKMNILNIIIGAIMGGLLGYIISGFI